MANKSANSLVPMTEDYSLEPPDVMLDDSDERKKKTLSRSKQWREQLEYLKQRQELYRKQVPGGALYKHMTRDDQAFYGAVGNAVIEEIDLWITMIEGY